MNAFTIPLPRYRCHKVVSALKIKLVVPNPRGYELHFEDERFAPFQVVKSWVSKHLPASGGYFVIDEDGRTSASPGDTFTGDYVLIDEDSGAAIISDPAPATISEDDLERMYWDFDATRAKGEGERLAFKDFLRRYTRQLGHEVKP